MKNKMIPFSLNSPIRVKLNDKGFAIWKAKDDRNLPIECQRSLEEYRAEKDPNGYVEFQAWCFMALFGDTMRIGGPHLFDMDVLLKVISK